SSKFRVVEVRIRSPFTTAPEERRCRRVNLPCTRASFLGTVQGKLTLCHRTPIFPLHIAYFQRYGRLDG
ncbi:MAG: hypothetical protein ACI9X0_001069, partial [Kiritimatiellia bacterium]